MKDIVCARCEDALPWLEDDSVDLIVTDPPYGISFMGKDWDRAVPSVDIWKECLRVLKPGGFAFVMSIPRMDCLSEMGKRLAEAGFEIGFSPIFWAYAQGFNKSGNMSKLIDKRACRNQLKAELGRNPTKAEMKEAWEGFREVVGKSVHSANRDSNIGYGSEVDAEGERYVTAPATPEAQALDGSYAGFQPKPAVEVVIVAMKPLSHGTYIDQALDNGHGVTWLDDGRIPYRQDDLDVVRAKANASVATSKDKYGGGYDKRLGDFGNNAGRFPANLLCSDDCLNDGSGYGCTGGAKKSSSSRYWGLPGKGGSHPAGQGTGGFSRFFSLDAWAIANLPESVQRTFPLMVVPKAAKSEKWFLCRVCDDVEHSSRKDAHAEHNTHCHTCGLEFNRDDEQQKAQHKGHKTETNLLMHPTQKPVKLFAYLITLGSRPGDLVADLFAGTCTTGMAAKTLGRDYLMVEQEEEWCRIGQRRTGAVGPWPDKAPVEIVVRDKTWLQPRLDPL